MTATVNCRQLGPIKPIYGSRLPLDLRAPPLPCQSFKMHTLCTPSARAASRFFNSSTRLAGRLLSDKNRAGLRGFSWELLLEDALAPAVDDVLLDVCMCPMDADFRLSAGVSFSGMSSKCLHFRNIRRKSFFVERSPSPSSSTVGGSDVEKLFLRTSFDRHIDSLRILYFSSCIFSL